MIEKMSKFIAYHPKTILLIATLLLIPSLLGYVGTKINYDILSYLPEDLDSVKGEVIHLTPIEYRILKLLAQNTGRVLTHSMIIRDVWGSLDQKSVPSLRVFMTTLRKKLEQNSDGEQYIQTRIGVGYRMAPLENR